MAMNDSVQRPLLGSDDLDRIYTKALPSLMRSDPMKAVRLLIEQLQRSIAIEVPKSLINHSVVWRPSISDAPEWFQKRDRTNVFISHLRRTVATAIAQKLIAPQRLIEYLQHAATPVITRIALDVAAEYTESCTSVAKHLVLQKEYFESPDLQIEYWKLMRRVFSKLSRREQHQVLSWIIARSEDVQDAYEDVEYAAHRLRDRLWVIREFLPKNQRDVLQRLVNDLGDARDLTVGSWPAATAFGPSSPIDADLIASAPVDVLIDALNAWRPEAIAADNAMPPSPEGAGRELKARVSRTPSDFTEQIDLLKTLEPTYVRSIVEGLDSVLRRCDALQWRPILEFCEWIVSKRADEKLQPIGFLGRDTDWTWTRRSVASLVLDGLTAHEHSIDVSLRTRVWNVISALLLDDDPEMPPADGRAPNDSSYANQALNSVRGMALRGVTEYARWIVLHAEAEDGSRAPLAPRSFAYMTEVKDALNAHLEGDANPIIRSVYGQQYGLLLALDGEWSGAAARRIFGENPYDSELTRAAWESYLVFSQPTLRAFEVLRNQYMMAVQYVADLAPNSIPASYDDREPYLQLSEHVFLHALVDKALDMPQDKLLTKLLDTHSSIAAHIMWLAPRTIERHDAHLRQRLQQYADWRIGSEAGATKEELKRFGWWLISDEFEPGWVLSRIARVTAIVGAIDPAYQVMERLVGLTAAYPQTVLECLENLVSETTDPWVTFGVQDVVRNILVLAVRSDGDLSAQVHRIASHMVRRGWQDFMEF